MIMTDHKYTDILRWVCNYKGKPKADKFRNSKISSPPPQKTLRHHHQQQEQRQQQQQK